MSHTIALSFNDFTFSPITRDNLPWFRAAELAHALGYGRENQVSRLYRNNADEFTENMTQVIEIPAEPRNGAQGELAAGRSRIFSLRGCHLIAMFARTPVAKAFRRWVLDVIEQYGDRVPVQPSAVDDDDIESITITPSTTESRKPLTAIINVWAQRSGQRHAECRAQMNAAFKLNSVKELPEEWIADACAWVQKKIDASPSYTDRQMLTAAVTAPVCLSAADDADAHLAAMRASLNDFNEHAAAMFGIVMKRLPKRSDKNAHTIATLTSYSMESVAYAINSAMRAIEFNARTMLVK